MTNFFRKIRFNLLGDNEIGKYLKYAFGEIILVVIGILIALQINNWNEIRKNESTEADYYCRILDDFKLNKKLIEENIELTSDRIKLSKELLMDLNSAPNDRSLVLNKFVIALRHDVSAPSNITFKDLTSSGQLKLLKDIKLKNSLIQYSAFLGNTLNLLGENRSEVVKRYTDFELITELGYQDIDYMNRELGVEHIDLLPKTNWTNDPDHPIFVKFQDNLVFILGMQIRQRQHFYNLKQEIKHSIELLKEKKCE